MRIAVLINLAPRKLGSLEGWLVALCDEARRRGYAVDVFGREPIHPQVQATLGALGVGWKTVDWLESSPLRAVRRLAAYDVLHVNMFQPRTPVALMAYAAWPARVLMVDHSSGPMPGTIQGSAARNVLRRAADRVSMGRVDHLAGVSNYVRDRDQRRFDLPSNRVRTLYNGVDMARFAPRREASSPPDETTMVAVAHLIPEKGVDTLLHAVAQMRFSRTPLTLVGDGPEAGRLQALAEQLGIASRVRFAGVRDDIPELMDAADIFVHPARWAEAFGLSIAEAMSMERGVVASRVGGIPELIEHGRSGLLVPPGDVAALAAALDFLVQRPEERLRLARSARRRVHERFSLEACVAAHLGWMEEALALPPRVPRAEQPERNVLALPATFPRAAGSNRPRPLDGEPLFGCVPVEAPEPALGSNESAFDAPTAPPSAP